ncbi:hypothetical protein FHT86_003187 [Rhizobium sp. BK313]|nr:hypothetical protein [Rhizobium sp. BK313]
MDRQTSQGPSAPLDRNYEGEAGPRQTINSALRHEKNLGMNDDGNSTAAA